MNTFDILFQIDAQIAKLQNAKAVLSTISDSPSTSTTGKRGRPKALGKKTALSVKRAPGLPKGSGTKVGAAPVKGKRTMSPEGKARIAAAQKARWALAKKATTK
jgi:hypothetical protein